MASSDRYRGDDPDLLKTIRDLQRRVQTLEHAAQSGNTSVGKGGTFRIRDDTGDVRVELGLLPDGTYGMRVKELEEIGFVTVPLLYSAFITTLEQCNASAWTDLATVGPSVEVNVGPSGRLVVIATAWFVGSGASAASVNVDGVIGVHLSGANSYTPAVIPGTDTLAGVAKDAQSITVTSGSVNEVRNGSITAAPVFSGLTPGLTTVSLRYGRSVTGAGSVFFANRTITAIRI